MGSNVEDVEMEEHSEAPLVVSLESSASNVLNNMNDNASEDVIVLSDINNEQEHDLSTSFDGNSTFETSSILSGGSEETVEMERSNILEYTTIDLSPWDDDTNESKYQLWKNNESFRNHALKYVNFVTSFGNGCIEVCMRAHARKPTVNEFWSFCMSKRIPRQSWFAIWKTVNHERHGWPLQYTRRAKVYVKVISFGVLANPICEIEIVEAYDAKYEVGQMVDVCLWQLEPVSTGDDFFHDGISIEEGKSTLDYIRKFYEEYYFSSDTTDFVSFFENVLYDRLELSHFLANPAPTQGILSRSDRGKIIAAIKNYHFLKNKLQDLNQLLDQDRGEDATDSQEIQSCYLTTKMQLDRHKVEIRFLLDKTLRSLIGAIDEGKAGEDDAALGFYDVIVVGKHLSYNDLEKVITYIGQLKSSGPVGNIGLRNDLEVTLRNCKHDASIFVLGGEYRISGMGRLAANGSITGIKSTVDVTITPTDHTGDVWLLISAESEHTPIGLSYLSFVVEDDNQCCDAPIVIDSGHVMWISCNLRQRTRNSSEVSNECGAFDESLVRCANGATYSITCECIE